MIYTVIKCDKCGSEFDLNEDGCLVMNLTDIGGGVTLHLCPTHGRQMVKSMEKYIGKPLVKQPEQQELDFEGVSE